MGENGEVLIPVNLEIDEAQKALTQFARKAARTEIDIRLQVAGIEATEAEITRLRAQLEALEEETNGMLAWNGRAFVPTELYDESKIKQMSETRQRLGELNDKLADQKTKLEQLKTEANEYTAALKELNREAGNTTSEVGASEEKTKGLGDMIAGMAKRVFVFSVMTSALRLIRSELGGILSQNTELMTSVGQLRGSFMTLANGILGVLIPAITTAIQVLNLMINQIGRFLFSIFGISWNKAQEGAKAVSASMGKAASSAKEMQKSLMSFDELNRLDDNSSAGGGGGGGASLGSPSFDTGEISDKLYEIEAIALGAMLALGLVLFFTGANSGLGLGLIIAGALGLVAMIKEDWDKLPNRLQRAIIQVMNIAAAGLIGLGVVMLLAGQIPLGIGMIIAGGALGVSAAVLNWGGAPDKVSEILTRIMDMISKAILAIGVLLIFAGNFPLGFGLIVGALATRQVIIPNWSSATDTTDRIFKTLMGIISAGILVLGVLLILSGVNAPLGFSLVLAGAAGLAALKAFTWDFIVNKVKEIWDQVKAFYNKNIAKIFTKQFWIDKWQSFKETLPQVIKGALNSAIALFNQFISWINSKMNISWSDKYVLGQKVLSAGSLRLLPYISSIPQLAAGAVVPPNNQFLALLGDNKTETEVVSPLSTMKEALLEALQEANGQQSIVINIDGRKLFDIVVDRNNNEVRRTGASPLLV